MLPTEPLFQFESRATTFDNTFMLDLLSLFRTSISWKARQALYLYFIVEVLRLYIKITLVLRSSSVTLLAASEERREARYPTVTAMSVQANRLSVEIIQPQVDEPVNASTPYMIGQWHLERLANSRSTLKSCRAT